MIGRGESSNCNCISCRALILLVILPGCAGGKQGYYKEAKDDIGLMYIYPF